MTTAITKKFNSLIDTHRRLRQQYQIEAQSLLKDLAKEFFQNYPEIKLISWTQYTPYFNDGDTCVFRVNDVYFSNAEGNEVDNITAWGEYEGKTEGIFSSTMWGMKYEKITLPEATSAACEDVSSIINSSEMRDVLQEMFGDHVSIQLTANGFNVSEFDHD